MSFFDAFEKLRNQTPKVALMNLAGQNSGYGNFTFQCIDSYYCIGSDFLSNSQYNYWGYHNKSCVDCTYCRYCEDCYECVDCQTCGNCGFLQDCESCENCFACYDCISLKDCFACIGLYRKQYYIYNKPYAKEEYFQKLAKLKQKLPSALRELFKDVKLLRPHIYIHQSHNRGVCTGDYIYFSSDSQFCFDVYRTHNSLYMNNAINCHECCDISFAGEASLSNCYEIMSGMGLENCGFCSQCWHGKNLEYCELCFNCEYCFGCASLKGRKFCILNTLYNPQEYFKEVEKIKREMKQDKTYGEWFRSSYPAEDSKAYDEFARIEHRLEKQTVRKKSPRFKSADIMMPHA